ncbi:MAG: hypothetical protein ACTSU2_16335 [Promethearchaeota archaeon]
MEHEDVGFNRANRHEQEGETQGGGERDIVYPSFYIDKDGRSVCEEHTQIKRIKALSTRPSMVNTYERLLTCKTCGHYFNDDCYFPKSEIDKIEEDRLNRNIHCQLCGAMIDRPLTIMHSLYYKNMYNIEMPLICCACYNSLMNNTYFSNSKKRMLFFLTSLGISFYFLISYFITIIMFNFWGILIFIIPFAFWAYISFKDIKNIIYLWKGRRYYKKTFYDQLHSGDDEDEDEDEYEEEKEKDNISDYDGDDEDDYYIRRRNDDDGDDDNDNDDEIDWEELEEDEDDPLRRLRSLF